MSRRRSDPQFERRASLAALIASLSTGQTAFAVENKPMVVEEIIVTARKRSESLQDIPVSMQAFDQQRIDELNLLDFDDFARFAPSISFVSAGPGQTKLVIRGVAESSGTRTGQASAAIYLDEQPLTSNSLTPDPRIIDIERIEVLPGPQGTLYGASSQSGTLKIVTNKPDPSARDGFIEATVATVTEGDESYDLNGMLNLPLIDDVLALRLVGFYGEEAGFIDNVLGSTPGGTDTNANVADDNVNRQTKSGGRLSLLWNVSDRVTLTGGYVFQDTDLEGPSAFDPDVGDLKTINFYDEFFEDEWQQYSATLDVDVGFADLVVASSFYKRRIQSISDNTAYMQYLTSLAAYDPTYYSFYDFGPDPIGFYDFRLDEERTAVEMRLSSKGAGRLSWIVGAFYEKIDGDTGTDAHINDYPLTPSFASVSAYLAAPTDIYFFQRTAYDQDQIAAFGEVGFAFTERLTGTLGGRYFDSNNDGGIVTDIPQGLRIENSVLKAPEDGFTPKVGLSYQLTDDVLLYGVYSQGFRLGGANRDRPGLAVPLQYDSDKLTNYELGAKTQWLDGGATLNVAAFLMSWDDFQLEVRNPDPSTFFFVISNVGQAEITGLEAEFALRPIDNLTLSGAFTVLNAELSDPSDFLNAPRGTRLPVSPELKYALNAEYSFSIPAISATGYLRGDVSYTGDSVNSVDPASAQELDSYTLSNFQLGFDRDDFSVNLFVNNAFDERAQYFISPATYSNAVTPNRPREVGLTLTVRY